MPQPRTGSGVEGEQTKDMQFPTSVMLRMELRRSGCLLRLLEDWSEDTTLGEKWTKVKGAFTAAADSILGYER